jgi:hypothetical protein
MMESWSDELKKTWYTDFEPKRTWYIDIPKSSTKRLKLTEIRVTISSRWYGTHSYSLGDGLLAFDLPVSIEPNTPKSILNTTNNRKLLDIDTFTVKAVFKNSTGSRVQEQYINPIEIGADA